MDLNLKIIAATALLLPVAAAAQTANPGPPPADNAAAQPADNAKGQADTQAQSASKPQADAAAAPAKAAEKADVKAGATVFDSTGNAVGKIESVDSKGAVLNTGKVSVHVPLSALARGDKGLTINMTKSDIEAAAKKSD
jgi:hypothetical protein